jgi:hypothetical protein
MTVIKKKGNQLRKEFQSSTSLTQPLAPPATLVHVRGIPKSCMYHSSPLIKVGPCSQGHNPEN